jgi:hypothetical protein
MASQESIVPLTSDDAQALERLRATLNLGTWKIGSPTEVSPENLNLGDDDDRHSYFHIPDKYEVHLANIDMHLSKLVNIESNKLITIARIGLLIGVSSFFTIIRYLRSN